MAGVGDRIKRTVQTSVIGTLLRGSSESVQNAGKRLGRVARNSFVFQWLTKEPEPEVVVIDLRETWTVGPLIGLLEWTIAQLAPYWRESALQQALIGVTRLGESAAETRIGQVIIRLLSPPEPPEESTERNE